MELGVSGDAIALGDASAASDASAVRDASAVGDASAVSDASAVGDAPKPPSRQRRHRLRELEKLDRLLDDILRVAPQDSPLLASLMEVELPLVETGEPAATRLSWSGMAGPCDPCRIECHASKRMAAGQPRGDRKREQVAAFAWLIDTVLLPQAAAASASPPTIVDAGCSTGSLLLPLAFAFPHARFVGVDMKRGSLARLRERAEAAGGGLSERVTTWQGRIEDYTGSCSAVVALHACGGASDAALGLARRHAVPFAVSPCCVGKLSFGTSGSQPRAAASAWLLSRLRSAGAATELGGELRAFGLLAAWADSSSLALHGDAVRRQRRAKRAVEIDRLGGMGQGLLAQHAQHGQTWAIGQGLCRLGLDGSRPAEAAGVAHGVVLGEEDNGEEAARCGASGGLGGGILKIGGPAMHATSSLTDVLVGPTALLLAALPALLRKDTMSDSCSACSIVAPPPTISEILCLPAVV